ncbi:MAG: hypothetical protein HY909_19630 [Deltaproteobacteria bacterium]|nr:hypothetical protein [Deltaproteobacteria bacterium]
MRRTLPLVFAALSASCAQRVPVTATVAQVERVRAGITLAEPSHAPAAVEDVRRLLAGTEVATDGTGRALVTLDHGEHLLLDHDSRVRVTDERSAVVLSGRVWLTSYTAPDPLHPEPAGITVGTTRFTLRRVRASVQVTGDGAQVAVLDGEAAFRGASQQGVVHAGEEGRFRGGRAEVLPRALMEDWTGGLADESPLGAGEALGLGAVAARRPEEQGAPRWPLGLQQVNVHTALLGDLAVTDLEQSFFNPSADTVEGLYTLTIPRGAVLQRFAVDRHGELVDGVVRERQAAAAAYQAQVYRGSTHDPALLEWDAPGRYHARLYPLAPGSVRRIAVTYTQWLPARDDGSRAWRLPLATLGTRIGELRADIDLSRLEVRDLRASLGAVRENDHLYITRSDLIPHADLVVEYVGRAPGDGTTARVLPRAGTGQPGEDRGGFVRAAVRAPQPEARSAADEGLDLVILVDHSAATDPNALQLEQSLAEALVRSLTPRDRFVLLAGDVGTRAPGRARAALESATEEHTRSALEALSSDHRGGATDLGAMLEAAQGLLDPQHNGAIVYLGDGDATVGEHTLASLRARLARISPRPRLYAVAVGEAPRLDLLAGVTEPSGFAARVVRRGDVARTALEVISHAARPLVRGFQIDLGPGVERVYPIGPVDLPAGESLVAVGRYQRSAPTSAVVRATWHGVEATRTVPLLATTQGDPRDLRARWATARLEHLLAQGESRAVVVELGTRFSLITPYTSLYVPSEDEVPPPQARVSDNRSLSVFDFLPLVGCQQARSVVGASQEAPPSPPPMSSVSASGPASTPTAAPAAPPPVVLAQQRARRGSEERSQREVAGDRAGRDEAERSNNDGPATEAAPEQTVELPTSGTFGGAPGGSAGGGGEGGSGTRTSGEPMAQGAQPLEPMLVPPADPAQPVTVAAPTPGPMGAPAAPMRSARYAIRAPAAAARPTPEGLRGHGGSGRVTNGTTLDLGAITDGDGADDGLVDNLNRNARGPTGGANNEDQRRGGYFAWNDRTRARGDARAGAFSRCSDAAAVSLPERVRLWRERLGRGGALGVWAGARSACELPGWPDKAALLGLLYAHAGSLDGRLALYRGLRSDAGARDWLRRAILRDMARSGELARASELGLARLDAETLTAALARATNPRERFNVLRALVQRFGDDLELAMLALDAAAAVNETAEVRRLARRVREDPRTDARVRTAVGEALLAVGDEAEARRAFSEIVEFAPEDPHARLRLGDIALAHGWADEAYRQFQTLAALLNDQPDVILREAWAARRAGRLDEALRLAERVTTQSAPGNGGAVAEAAAAWVGVELALAGSEPGVTADTLTALRARWRRSPAARSSGAVRVLLRWEHPDDAAELWLALPGDSARRADVVASTVPLETSVFAEAPTTLTVEVRRAGGARPRGRAELVVLWNEGSPQERVARQALTFDPDHLRFVYDAQSGALAVHPEAAR